MTLGRMIEGRSKRMKFAYLLALTAALALLALFAACGSGEQGDTARLPFRGVT